MFILSYLTSDHGSDKWRLKTHLNTGYRTKLVGQLRGKIDYVYVVTIFC